MAKHKTTSSNYRSQTTPNLFITAAQYIAELVCIKIAQFNHESIGGKFWQERKWKKKYVWQVICANELLNKYSDVAIINAINRMQVCFSLKNNKKLINLIEQEQETVHRHLTQKVDIQFTNREQLPKKSMRQILDE